jgi:hypothetical protein
MAGTSRSSGKIDAKDAKKFMKFLTRLSLIIESMSCWIDSNVPKSKNVDIKMKNRQNLLCIKKRYFNGGNLSSYETCESFFIGFCLGRS